jgi:acetyl esterase/lipase
MYRILARLGIVIVMALTTVTLGAASVREPAAAATVTPSPVVGDQMALPYGSEPYQVLDLRLPDATVYPGARPVIIYLHSGGWIAGDRTNVPDVALVQVNRGYAVASVDYRLATATPDGQPNPSFPGVIWDVKRAIRFLKTNATTWNLDPRRVILMGGSAGGYLAAFVGATAGLFEPPDLPTTSNERRDSSVKGVLDLVGPTNLVSFEQTDHPWAAPLTASFLGCATPTATNPMTCPDDRLATASVLPYVDSSDPPIFLGYGADDTLVVAATQGEPLARVWTDTHAGNTGSVSYDVVAGAGHILPFDDTVNPITEFFDRVTAGRGHAL